MQNRSFVAVFSILAFVGPLRADGPAVFTSPTDLWQGFDPTVLPLDVTSLEKWEEQGCAFEKMRFTAEEIDGGKVRIFAIAGTALAGPAQPGILHIHGGGQTASVDWVRFWTKRGYACVTYDFCGPWPGRTDVTDWGPLKHGNMADAGGGHQVTPTLRNSSWYHWTLAARRALTLLAKQPRVDRERLGIFGISVGGTLCWSVAGSDSRVKTAVPIYGCGYNVDGGRARWGFPALTAELALFQRVLSPEAHAPYITCPVLHLNATNDFHGWMDRAYDILAATDGPTWKAFTPRQNHHIAATQGIDLPAWMDFQLKGGAPFPTSPMIGLQLTPDGVPRGTLDAGGEPVAHVDVYYSLTDKPAPNRFSAPHSRPMRSWEVPGGIAGRRYLEAVGCVCERPLFIGHLPDDKYGEPRSRQARQGPSHLAFRRTSLSAVDSRVVVLRTRPYRSESTEDVSED